MWKAEGGMKVPLSFQLSSTAKVKKNEQVRSLAVTLL
jgi:hypothetical protein